MAVEDSKCDNADRVGEGSSTGRVPVTESSRISISIDDDNDNEVNFEHSLFMVRVDIIKTTMDLGVVTKGIRDLSFSLRKLSSISIKRFSN